jgi:hypothetical protein
VPVWMVDVRALPYKRRALTILPKNGSRQSAPFD